MHLQAFWLLPWLYDLLECFIIVHHDVCIILLLFLHCLHALELLCVISFSRSPVPFQGYFTF